MGREMVFRHSTLACQEKKLFENLKFLFNCFAMCENDMPSPIIINLGYQIWKVNTSGLWQISGQQQHSKNKENCTQVKKKTGLILLWVRKLDCMPVWDEGTKGSLFLIKGQYKNLLTGLHISAKQKSRWKGTGRWAFSSWAYWARVWMAKHWQRLTTWTE